MSKMEIGIIVVICLATIGLYGLEWLRFLRDRRRRGQGATRGGRSNWSRPPN